MSRGRKSSVRNTFERRAKGSGTIQKASGNRRKPYCALVELDRVWDDTSMTYSRVRKSIGYFATKDDAVLALNQYFDDPWDLSSKSLLFEDVYAEWSSRYYRNLTNKSSERSYTAAFNHSSYLHKIPFNSITVTNLKDCLNSESSPSTAARMKSLFNLMWDFAVESEITNVNVARNFNASKIYNDVKKNRKVKNVFTTDNEVSMWNNIEYGFTRMLLIALYTGFRPHELCTIRIDSINLEDNSIVAGEKTDAGRDRYVPIHPAILPLIMHYYNLPHVTEYLFEDPDGQQGVNITVDKWKSRFCKSLSRSGINPKDFSPHCTRHTFITRAKESGMDLEAIQLIVGHEFSDVTHKVYIHSNQHEYLHREIRKLIKPC